MASTEMNATEIEEMVAISFANLERTYGASIGLLSTGLLAIVTNILVWITVAKTQNLHNVCFLFVAQLAIGDFIVGVGYVFTGVKRLIRYHGRIHEVNSQVVCAMEMFVPYLGLCASLSMALLVAFERLMSTLQFQAYLNNPQRNAIVLSVLGWLYAIVDSLCMFTGISNTKLLASCTLSATVSDIFYKIQAVHHVSQVFVISGLYAILFGYIHYQVKSAEAQQQGNIAQLKKKFEVRIGRMLAVIGVLYLVTQLFTWSILFAIRNWLPHAKASVAPYVRSVMVLNSGVNFFVYLSMSTEFRAGFYAVIGKDTTTAVVPIGQSTKQNQQTSKV